MSPLRSPVGEQELLAAVGQGWFDQVLANVSIVGWEQASVAVTTDSLLDYLEGTQDEEVYRISSRFAYLNAFGCTQSVPVLGRRCAK